MILINVLISLAVSSFIGSKVIDSNKKDIATIATIGCGVGIQKGKQYASALTPSELTFCLFFGAQVEEAFSQDVQ